MTKPPSPELVDQWAQRVADTLDRAVAIRHNEQELREDAESVIREALQDLYAISLDAITAETNTRGYGTRSPVDKVYGGVLVEYEWNMDAGRRRHGADQALTYLKNIREKTGATDAFTAIVCDGKQWGFLVIDPTMEEDLFHQAPDEPDGYFQWHVNNAASARRFLLLCGSHHKSPLTGPALAGAFGPESPEAKRFVQLLSLAFDGREPNDRADTLYHEWSRSTEVVYGSLASLHSDLAQELREQFDIPAEACRSLAEILFVLHTYFSLVARLIAGEVLALAMDEQDSQPSHWSGLDPEKLAHTMRRFDAGELPEGLEVQNLFEADVFSWYVDTLLGDDDLQSGLGGILNRLDHFAFPRVMFGAQKVGDNLRELYQRLIPRPLRKQLGEYPTPSWLAEASLQSMIVAGARLDEGRVLDPTCGTGAFLLPILRARLGNLRIAKGQDITANDIQQILDSIVGFDINPIAITATRANFIVALGNLAALGAIRLSIWRSDSIINPSPKPNEDAFDEVRLMGHPVINLETSLETPFPMPQRVTGMDQVAAIRSALEDSMQEPSIEQGRQIFSRRINAALRPGTALALSDQDTEWNVDEGILEVLYERVRELSDAGRDGVWARIIENSFAPILAGRFDVVVGNPPWLGWPKLPERWRDQASRYWKRYGLWTVPLAHNERLKPFAQFNDLATLVFATALARYVKSGGHVGFLVPEALIFADPGARAFRKYHLKSEGGESGVDVHFRVLSSDNWRDVKPFGSDAANNPVFLVARSDTRQEWPVPSRRWRRAIYGAQLPNTEWKSVRPLLTNLDGHSHPVDRSAPWSAWSFTPAGMSLMEGGSNSWSFGMGVNTRGAAGVYYVDVLGGKASTGLVKIRNRPEEGHKKGISAVTRSVESSLIYPQVRGRDIRAWSARPSGFIVVPHDPTNIADPLSDENLSNRYPEADKWLRRHSHTLKSRSVPNKSWDVKG